MTYQAPAVLPRSTRWFGYGGLLPFLVLAMGLPALTESQHSGRFAWSIVPALVAWLSLLFSPPIASPLLVSGFIAHYLQDRWLARQAVLPDGYLTLRLRLSSVAVVCLVVGALAS